MLKNMMTDDVFNRNEADELTLIIAKRLGRRQAKLERMAEWERPARRAWLRPLAAGVSIAACLAVAFLLLPLGRDAASPWDELGLDVPMLEEYRAPLPELSEINQLIGAQRYDEALLKTEVALNHSDAELEDLNMALMAADEQDEELLYEEDAELDTNAGLRWAYVYLLIQMGRYDDALVQLKRYLKMPARACPHKAEAKALMRELKKRAE